MLKDKRGIAQTQHNLGIISFAYGDLDKANLQYLDSFRIKQKLGDKRGMAITLHQMGNLACAINDMEEARSLYQESLKIERELKDKQGMAITLAQLLLLEENAANISGKQQQIKHYERLEKKGR